MKLISKFLSLGVLAAASTFAHATTLNGTIRMSSSQDFVANISSTGITFSPSGTGAETTTGGNGDFAFLVTPSTAGGDIVNLPTTINNIDITNAGVAGLQLYTFSNQIGANYDTFSFYATTFQNTSGPSGGAYAYTGYLTEQVCANSTTSCAAAFNTVNTSTRFTVVNSDTGITSFSSTSVAGTPEPNSLILLGTGLMSAASMVIRKRRKVVA